MSVWFKYPSDKDITPGHPSGSSVFAPGTVGGGYPAYGTTLSTGYGVDYENGATAYSIILAGFVYVQSCNVDTKADGSGGSYVDWANATNIQYKPVGTFIATSTEDFPDVPVEVPSGSGTYHTSGAWTERNEVHDGNGGINTVGTGTFSLYAANTLIYGYSVDHTVEIPPSSGNNWSNGIYDNYEYQWNGTGGYNDVFISQQGSFYNYATEVSSTLRYTTTNAQTEIPDYSGAYYDNGKYNQDTYYWNSGGGYYTDSVAGNPQGSYFSFGTFITDQNCPVIGVSGMGLGYFWDGNGGNYINTYP